MTEEKKGEVKTFAAKCKTFAKAASEARKKQEVEQMQEPELTIEQKLENVTNNVQALLNSHSNAINAISYWIAQNDTKVAKAGNVLNWALKEQQKQQRIEEKKANYAKRKAAGNSTE